MGSDASATDTAHPAGAHALERSTFRSTAVSRSRSRPMDLLSGFERPSSSGSLFELLLVRGALELERAYSSAG